MEAWSAAGAGRRALSDRSKPGSSGGGSHRKWRDRANTWLLTTGRRLHRRIDARGSACSRRCAVIELSAGRRAWQARSSMMEVGALDRCTGCGDE